VLTRPDIAGSNQAAQVTLALGSHDLEGHVVDVDAKSRTATVAFVGTNPESLGSAMASSGGARSLGEQIAPATGPLSTVNQSFGWLQTIKY
jgi:hypothetical protein